MTKLTAIFKIHDRFGSRVEIIKKIGDNKVIVPVSRNEVKSINGEIFVNPETINRLAWFFKKVK